MVGVIPYLLSRQQSFHNWIINIHTTRQLLKCIKYALHFYCAYTMSENESEFVNEFCMMIFSACDIFQLQ